jgi:hypothetical protein
MQNRRRTSLRDWPGVHHCATLAKPQRPTEFSRRDVDEHETHRPPPEPVLRRGRFPARQRDPLASEPTNPRWFEFDDATMDASQRGGAITAF